MPKAKPVSWRKIKAEDKVALLKKIKAEAKLPQESKAKQKAKPVSGRKTQGGEIFKIKKQRFGDSG